jgi:branched-chain amino acid transport system substrate-binding protein
MSLRETPVDRFTCSAGRHAAVAVFAIAFSVAGCAPAVPDTVKIGVGVTLSGPTANRGQDLLNGALLAADELNAVGFTVAGKPVKFEIVSKDDKADAEATKQAAQELVDADVHAVIGHVNTQQTQVALPIYAAKKLPHLFTSTNAKLTAMGSGNTLRLVANDTVQARALGSFAVETLGARKIVALVETSDYGRDMFADMAAWLKSKDKAVALKIDIDFKTPVTDDMASQIKSAQADVVVLIGREVHGLSLVEKLQAAQYTDVSVLAVNPVKTTKMAQSRMLLEGFYATATTIDPGELVKGPEFLSAFRNKFKTDPVWGAHYAYDAVYALAGAMRGAQSVKSADVLQRLRSREADTRLLHQLRFDENGEQKYPSIGIYKIERGAWVPQMRSSSW